LIRMSMLVLITQHNNFSDAFSPSISGCRSLARHRQFAPARMSGSNNKSDDATTNNDEPKTTTTTTTRITKRTTPAAISSNSTMFFKGVDRIFDTVDVDGSGAIDLEEYDLHLSSAGYSKDAIRKSFSAIDSDGNGEISRDELRGAIISNLIEEEGEDYILLDCPMGYWLDSVRRTCQPLGPMGRLSQRIENLGPLKNMYRRIANVFGVNKEALRKRGVPFLLTYSIISNLNGAMSLTVAWYMTVRRTGLSPLAPGGKKSLLTSYAMIYGALQLLKPFRVAAAIAMSKLSAEYLDMTQDRLNCSRNVAIGCQYMMGQLMMGITFYVGVTIVSLLTGVPIWG